MPRDSIVPFYTATRAQIAEGMGAVGLTVKKVGEMRPALQEAQRLNADGKTVLIDVHTSMESKQSRF